MTQQRENYDPSPEYTAPAEEWAALLTLAADPAPARALVLGGWKREHFASEGAPDAYSILAATATGPILLTLPAALDGVTALEDPAQLAEKRARLASLAQARMLDSLQANLARVLRTTRATGKTDGIGETISASRGALEQIETLGTGARIRAELATLGALAAGYWAHVAEAHDAMATSLAGLDKMLGGGLQAKRLMVLLGAPGSGKTTLANQIAEHIASAGRPVVYLTTEDTPAALLAKTVARVGGLEYGAVLQGRENLRPQISAALADVAQRQSAERLLYIEDTGGLTLGELREMARPHFAKYAAAGAGVLVVDYLQRWARAQRGANGQREELREAVGRLTEELRAVARELNCCIVALASQNRASGYGKNGDTSALASAKESGDIEYTADVIMALGEDSDKERTPAVKHEARALRVDKNRLGTTGKLALDWYPSRQTWTEAEK